MAYQCHHCPLIGFGILLTIAGIITTIVGNEAKPFWNDCSAFYFKSSVQNCESNREEDLAQLANCRIAGPFVFMIGIFMTSYGFVIRKRARAGMTGYTTLPTTTTHSSTGAAAPRPGPGTTGHQYQINTGTGYPQSYHPTSTTYPGGIPPGNYPPPPAYDDVMDSKTEPSAPLM